MSGFLVMAANCGHRETGDQYKGGYEGTQAFKKVGKTEM